MVDTIVDKLLRYIIIQGLSRAAVVQLVLPTLAANLVSTAGLSFS